LLQKESQQTSFYVRRIRVFYQFNLHAVLPQTKRVVVTPNLRGF